MTNAYKVNEGNYENRMNWDTCPKMLDGVYSVEDFVKTVDILPISFKAYRREWLLSNNIQYFHEIRRDFGHAGISFPCRF